MRRFILSLIAACFVASTVAAPVAAQAQSRESQRLSNDANDFVVAIGLWAQQHNEIIRDEMGMLMSLNAGSEKAADYFAKGQTREGKAWATVWAAEQRQMLVDLKARLATIPPQPPRPTVAEIQRDPTVTRMLQALGRVPSMTAARLDRSGWLQEHFLDLIVRTASGDADAADKIAVAYFDTNIAILETQIETTDIFAAIAAMGQSPQEQALRGSNGVLRGMVVTYRAIRADIAGEPVDRAASATAVRQQAVVVDRELATMRRRIAEARALNIPGEFGIKIKRVMDSFEKSESVIADLAGRLRSVADAIEQGPRFDAERVATLSDALIPVMDQLIEQDNARKAIMLS